MEYTKQQNIEREDYSYHGPAYSVQDGRLLGSQNFPTIRYGPHLFPSLPKRTLVVVPSLDVEVEAI